MTQTSNTGKENQALYFDHTRKSAFFKCPRLYYFRHIRHWEREGSKPALTFGGGIHEAMEVIWGAYKAQMDLPKSKLLALAMDQFEKRWVEDGFSTDETLMLDSKRTPGIAMEILDSYLSKYSEWLSKIEILEIEKPFVIPIEEEGTINFIGRWDKVWREKGHIYVGEHKTTSVYRKVGTFSKEFIEGFSPDDQVDGYAYAATAVYGKIAGVIVDGILVHKTVRGFTRIPISKHTNNLEAWIWETRYWINEILDNISILVQHENIQELPFLPCFPKRTEHCQHKYGTCSYHNICRYMDPNPERIEDPPDNFQEHAWDPFAHNVEEGQEVAFVGSGS